MKEFGKQKVFSDIGCYTLGALPPWNSINSCVDMGASITMAKGAADAGVHPSVAVIGDSTFTHSGMTALLDCVYENTPVTVIISDNCNNRNDRRTRVTRNWKIGRYLYWSWS
ncbi:MAG: thiamine pyrophosphate-dependent enzyme [Ignavibacteriales bacterium]|nr:thiamine pyrophosphate-dependent enzyme [Ignavibacteriales bacterium]